jgi:NCAIR mutase (PurE)-related protein
MNQTELLRLLEQVRTQDVDPVEALRLLEAGPFRQAQSEYADLDHHRKLRHGITEVVYGESKSVEQIVSIAGNLAAGNNTVLITRLVPE